MQVALLFGETNAKDLDYLEELVFCRGILTLLLQIDLFSIEELTVFYPGHEQQVLVESGYPIAGRPTEPENNTIA